MKKLYWIGPRESDIKYTGNLFDGSITLYGDGRNNNASFCLNKDYRINHNHITDEQTMFMIHTENSLLDNDDEIRFISYNPNLIYSCDKRIVDHTLCLNDEKLMRQLDSKVFFREFAKKIGVPVLHSELIPGSDCCINAFEQLFPNSREWIVQADIASGGYQTFWVTKDNAETILTELDEETIYLVSPYYHDNIPINIHAILYEKDILLTPGSVQVECLDRNRLLYRGADYITYRDISPKIIKQFEKDVEVLCREIQNKGYRGLIGIDAMIVDGVALILEVNNRFQASTILINRTLEEMKMPSLHMLHYEAFYKSETALIDKEVLRNLIVNYSIYAFIQEETMFHAKNILQKFSMEKTIVDYIDDGYLINQVAENDAYLFKLIFNVNIVSITDECTIRLHPNIKPPSIDWYNDIIDKNDFKKLKISLLNQGIVLSEAVKQYLNTKGGMRPGVYFAVDLTLNDKYIVNAPLYVKFASLSPFTIKLSGKKLVLFYYEHRICNVRIDSIDTNSLKSLAGGVPVNKICLWATDRLRIQNSDFCIFKENNIPCRFCEACYKSYSFGIAEIKEALDLYFSTGKIDFDHVLIGGLSNAIGKEKTNILAIVDYIRTYSEMPIYLMSLPPVNPEDIIEYYQHGVTEFGFNLEIFDRKLAAEYMPGKGKIPLERYNNAWKKAVELVGNTGNVRSAFVVGLESMESTLQGVEHVCKNGVAPIFSVFRPIPETEMQYLNPPDNEWLLELYDRAEAICRKYSLMPGPVCPACQNNTLSFDPLPEKYSNTQHKQ